tara:strand:- start:252 stop:683 length:432 start_codon:yes stop_codon:yes gene_type:complete
MWREERMLYMAYGMNTNIPAMEARCPLAKPLGGFYLPNYKLVFRGVADIVPDRDSVVPVVLWSITSNCLSALDRLEGYPKLYNRKKINNGWWVYTMNNKQTIAKPSDHYLYMIQDGYRAFDLDEWHLLAAASESGYDTTALVA